MMKHKAFKKIWAVLLIVALVVGLWPAVPIFANEPTAPVVEDFATADELRANFDMDDATSDKTFKKVYFGIDKTWSIVGVDPVGGGLVLLSQNYTLNSYFSSSTDDKDYDPAWALTYEDGFVPEKVAPNHYGASDMRAVFKSYTDPDGGNCWFTVDQLALIIPTTIYTADVYNTDDDGNPRVYHSTELLYPTYSTDYRSASAPEGRIQYVTVGSNSANDLGTDLKVSLKTNVINSFTRSAWVSGPNNTDRVLLNTNNGVDLRWADDKWGYLPVFQLDTSKILFGSIYQGVTAEGEQKDPYGYKIFTLRMDAGKSNVKLGTVNITAPAMEYATVNDATDGTYLVVQCGEGAWAKAVSGDMTFSASDLSGGKITSFENCKVWLEKTDANTKLTYASYANTVSAYSVGITSNAKLVRDENSGEENQVSLDDAPITDIVYTTVEDYYFPEDYCDTLGENGITVTRNSDTQIIISGIPTADVYITLPVPGYGGTKDKWDGVTVASGYESGDGTQENPYVIANSQQFAYFAQQMTAGNGVDAYYELTADLELTSKNWETIPVFEGNFNGNGHTIVYTIKDTIVDNSSCYGLFGEMDGTVSNLNVSGDILLASPGQIKQRVYIGGLCGYSGGTVTNCSSDVEIRCDADATVIRPMIGGVVGALDGGTVEYSSYSGCVYWDATSPNNSNVIAGGIVGEIFEGTVSECFNVGSITVNCYYMAYTGGIVGRVYTFDFPATTTIDNCYNTGSVSAACVNKNAYTGGISGYLDAYFSGMGSSVSGCYSTGSLTSSTGDISQLSPVVNEFKLNDNYCLDGEDGNIEKVADKTELFEKLNAFAPNTWFIDKGTGDVRLLGELTVNPMPEAVFNADSENGGVLSNVKVGMRYSLDGGASWVEITDATAALVGVTTEKGILVDWPGDFHETNDSAVQTITITKAAVPTTAKAQGCTNSTQNNGKITGVDSTMEYQLEGSSTWTAITGDSVTDLKPGTYLVRVKGNGTVLASSAQTVTVGRYIPSSPTTYPPTIESSDHGSVEITPHNPQYQDEVTITPHPDPGYMVDQVTVTDQNGDSVSVHDNKDGTYSFTQPRGKVTITVTFKTIELPFIDVHPSDWFYDPVCYVYSQGLMTGTSATTFEPNTSLSRAMLVAVLHRLEGSPQASAGDFTDVAEGDWYAQAVNWAASVGVVNGFDDGTFQPNAAITREQMAAILRNYAAYKGMDVTASGDLSTYSDAASVSDWAKDSVEWAVGQGLISGITIDTLQPQGLSTRAQVAA
ncbi:MAG: S-layer homology domain-containing protein, partial [Peptococcaceae bacterium]|nr:S-layer homology domain-containing protein [Peptococcaceae bacterium]